MGHKAREKLMAKEKPDLTNQIQASELETGDLLRDTEGHGKTNPYGPDLTDDIVVKQTWHGDSWLLAPKVENGLVSNKSFALSYDEIDERVSSGRYEIVDCEACRSLNEDALPFDPDQDVFIRFGDIPEDERSHNHTDDRQEPGVSVYAATVESVPSDVDAPARFVPYGNKLQQILFLALRDTYLVTGEEVGTGVDGEPLLRNVRVLAELERIDEVTGFTIKD